MLNVYVKAPTQEANALVIWMHGLGADANDMMALVSQLSLQHAVQHVFIEAPVRPVTINNNLPMRAWYDISGLDFNSREDKKGIVQSEAMIVQLIDEYIAKGFSPERIFLAGFSQGGAMALLTGLRYPLPLGGLLALSAYLPLASEPYAILHHALPIFFATGLYDTLVLPQWAQKSVEHLKNNGFHQLAFHRYPMEHAICAEEIRDINHWLNAQIKSILQREGETQ